MGIRKILFVISIILGISLKSYSATLGADSVESVNYDSLVQSIYKSLGRTNLSYKAFSYAYRGLSRLKSKININKKNILTVIDFNKSSKEDRFFIIDLSKKEILHESLVAHGKNSGWDIPTTFSNLSNSYMSSLGFYITGETYFGKHGLSLKLDGLEKGINDNARKRNIVIHAADYVSNQFIKQVGRLGRSFGCPSLPAENYTNVIDIIKNKSLIFIFSDQNEYLSTSDYL